MFCNSQKQFSEMEASNNLYAVALDHRNSKYQ